MPRHSVVANAPTKGTKESVAPENSKVVANQVFNHVTISDDRSAGSNLEVRNLLALEDKASQPASYRHHIVPVEEGSSDGQALNVISGSQEDYYTDTDEDDEWDYIDETQHSDSASRPRITHHHRIPPPAPPLRSTGSGTNRYILSIRNPWPRPRRSGPTLPNTLEGIDDYPGSGPRPPSPPLLAGARRVSSRTPPSRVGYRQSRYPPTHTATSDRRKNNPNDRTSAKIQRAREVPVEYGPEDDIQETTQENVVEHSETRLSSGEPITVDLKSYLEDHDSSKLDLKRLKGYIDMLRDKAQQFEEIQQANLPTRHQIVYRIVTSTGREYDYLDHPEWVASGSPLCESRIPLENLELYLERNKDISFVVFRYFHQTQQRKDGYGGPLGRSRTPRHHWESICPVTEDLGEAVESILKQSHEYSSMHSHYRMTQQIGAPYLFIYHNRERWESIVDQFDQPTQDQLNRLTDYVFEQFGRQYALADKLFSLGRISIDLIKFLFKPGDILVSCVGKEHLGYVAESWPEPDSHQHGHKPMRSERHRQNSNHMPRNPRDPSPDFSPDTDQDSDLSSEEDLEVIRQPSERKNENAATSVWTIEAWKWGFDGRFKRQQEELTLQFPLPNTSGSEQGLCMPNENQKRSKKKKPHTIQIEELNIYPIRFASETVVKKLQRRGQMFWKFRSGEACLVSYRDDENDYAENPSDERYMIDFKTFRTLHPSNTEYILKSTGNPQDELTPEQLSKEELPNEQFQYLLPLRIKGYNLRRKKWFDLESDRMFPVHWNRQAFETLVMDTKAKELIQALVSKQLAAEKATDIIAGKGNGLILLLHGGPGTGKTLTAESVAEVARKPLYRVTCGDVGTKAEDVEKYLESVLHLGKIWKCVVLLDEADVFLEQRSLEDLQRNALVSVFLRVLEYHEGILILTSNRVGTFDEAFKSRIQLALHYPSLGSYQRLRIWENFIQRLDSFDDGTVDINDLKRHLEELQKVEMNGRQIRNAITTARQYAEWKGEIMNYKYLKDVIEVSSRFDKYLDKLHDGHTFDELAENDGVR